MTKASIIKRPIRSFVRREGRMTVAQRHGIGLLMSKYGVNIEDDSIRQLANNAKRLVLEIGFGMGEGLYEMAAKNPQDQFIGIEVHRPGVGRLLNEIHLNKLDNVSVSMLDAKDVLEQAVPDNSLDRVQIFFPDPWPKKKHHKRRLIQVTFLELIAKKLKPTGILHLATDWQDYYEHMVEVVDKSSLFKIAESDVKTNLIESRPKTRFEQRGIRLGHTIYDLVYQKHSNFSQ